MHEFYKKTLDERASIVKNECSLDDFDINTLTRTNPAEYDSFIENVIGTFTLPMGIATNFTINSKKYLIPMVIEEPSVIAAASAGAKAATITSKRITGQVLGQIQVIKPVRKIEATGILLITGKAKELLSSHMRILSINYTDLKTNPSMAKLEIALDSGDAMGANAVNTICEGIAPMVENLTGGRALLRILSNNSGHAILARAVFNVDKNTAEDIVLAHKFASLDKNRAITHNKGIMNGITAVATATGQDTRAIEAAAHLSAIKDGQYLPLTKYHVKDGKLVGFLSLPIPVGTVGGLTTRHPAAKVALKILGNPGAARLAEIMAAVGLCQNFSALRALVTDGIQKGHMKLHNRKN